MNIFVVNGCFNYNGIYSSNVTWFNIIIIFNRMVILYWQCVLVFAKKFPIIFIIVLYIVFIVCHDVVN